MIKESKYSSKIFIKDIWSFLKPHKKSYLGYVLIFMLISVISLVQPILFAKTIDSFGEGQKNLTKFLIYFGILGLITVAGSVITLKARYSLKLLISKIKEESKTSSFEKLIQNDLIWHDKENLGNRIQMIETGVNAIEEFIYFILDKVITIIIQTGGIFVVFSYFGTKYGIIALIFILVYSISERFLSKEVLKRNKIFRQIQENVSGKSIDIVQNIHTIKFLGIEKNVQRIMNKSHKDLRIIDWGVKKADTIRSTFLNLIAYFFFSIFMIYAGLDILHGVLTAGVIVIYFTYMTRLGEILGELTSQLNNWVNMKHSFSRLVDVYNILPQVNEDNAKDLKTWNKINFEKVSFNYGSNKVFENLTLEIKKGEKIGIVGLSGSGKSTLFKLLLKLYLPDEGTICYSNKNLQDLKRESIIKRIAIVPQETEVFNLSLRKNIILSNGGKMNTRLYNQALDTSSLRSVVNRLPKKDLSLIGPKGVKLSGGERQRLGIARAIYKNSEILIFDEATSNLDYQTEDEIQKSLDKLENKTLIVAAHRLSTLMRMDKIFFLEKGKIVESGKYEELINLKGKFYMLLKKQEKSRRT